MAENVGQSDAVTKHLIKQDSLAQCQIDTLTNELNALRQEIADLKGKVKKLESPSVVWNYITVTALVLAIIALVVIILHKLKSRELSSDDVRNILSQSFNYSPVILGIKRELEDLKSRSLSQSYSNTLSRIGDTRKPLYQSPAYRDDAAKQQPANNPTNNTAGMNSPVRKEPSFVKVGYAKKNSEKYFVEVFDYQQDTCVYSIKFKNNNEGEFDIISLDKIKSRNDWQSIVEYQGDCTMEEANNYVVIKPGICKKSDGSAWEITSKLVIKISK